MKHNKLLSAAVMFVSLLMLSLFGATAKAQKISPGEQINWAQAAGCTTAGNVYDPSSNTCFNPSLPGVINVAVQSGTDIGQQLVNAVASCSATCSLYIPAGTYTFSTTAVLPLNFFSHYDLWLNAGATLLYTGSGDAIQANINTSGPTTSKFYVHGGQMYAEPTGAAPSSGLHIQSTNGVTISNMLIYGFTGTPGAGVWVDGANAVWVQNNIIDNNNVGVYATNTLCNGAACSPTEPGGTPEEPNAVHVINNTITGNVQWGVQFYDTFTNAAEGAVNDSIENNDLELNGSTGGSTYGAISVGRSTGMVISGNYFEGSPRNIVLGFTGSPGAFFGSYGPVIRGNYFTVKSTTPYLWELQDTTNALIDGNSTLVQTENTSNCALNETEAVGTFYGRNYINLTDPNTGAHGNLFCQAGTPETAMHDPSSFTFFNPNYQEYIAYQGYSINVSVTTENVAIEFLTGGGGCHLVSVAGSTTAINNGRASILAGTSYISALTTSQVTLTHPSGNAMTYDIVCYNNANGGFGPE